jgi:hypothetical protein
VADDFGLLLQPVTSERPAGFERIAVPAERVATQDQVDARLFLPDMRHFMDEQALVIDMALAKIAAIQIALGVKPELAVG